MWKTLKETKLSQTMHKYIKAIILDFDYIQMTLPIFKISLLESSFHYVDDTDIN